MPKRRTDEEIKEIINSYGYELLEIVHDKEREKDRVVIKDKNEYLYDILLVTILQLKKVANFVDSRNSKSLYNISVWIKKNKKEFYLLENNVYINQYRFLSFHCNKCDNDFYSSWGNIYIGHGCGVCRGLQVTEKTCLSTLRPDLAKEWSSNNRILPTQVSLHSNKNVEWICLICGNKWPSRIADRVDGNGCPNCSSSRGNKKVKSVLDESNINHISEYKFDDCRNILPLPFDFYLPDYNICIEYHGLQHYKETGWKKEKLARTKKTDKIKKNYCKKNKIKLIVIPYWGYDNIEEIIKKEVI